MSPHSSNKRDRPSGFTLIEVLIGSVLLATLAVSSMLGFRVHQRQLRFNQHRIEAVSVVDQLLFSWQNQSDGVPIGATGLIDARRQWWWRTRLVDAPTVFGQPTLVIRLEIVEHLPTPNQVLVSVEFVQGASAALPAS